MSKIVTTDAYIWSDVVATSGTPPSARAQHSAVGWIDPSTNEPKMSVFGGTGLGSLTRRLRGWGSLGKRSGESRSHGPVYGQPVRSTTR